MRNLLPAAQPTRDSNDPAGGIDLGDLPEWDLTDLYTSEDAPELARDLDWLDTACADFAGTYKGKLADLDAAGMLTCIQTYEKIEQVAGRVMSYAGLRHAQLTTDPARGKFLTDTQSRITDATAALVFFPLEVNRIEDARLDALLAENDELARYKPVLDRLRKQRPYQLSDELEAFLHDQSVVGASAWVRLFDETMAGLRFDIDGQDKGLEETLDLLTDHDRATREAGARALAAVFGDHLTLFSRITNTLAKEKAIEDRWRKLPSPQA